MIQIKEKYIVDKRGKTIDILVSKKNYEKLMEYIEELEDVIAYDKAKKTKGRNISWKKIKR